MRLALALGRTAGERGEVPVGAVLVSGGRVLARGHNQCIRRNDPTAHAEITAIRRAGRLRGNYRLPDADLYTTLEPCAMCLGAIVQARLRRLCYGAADPKAGAIRSTMRFPFGKLNHRPEIRGGVLADECGRLLKGFFADKRRKRARAARLPVSGS
ncbi:MAG: tRNA-specific adenosine deaminase [Candidatus Aminicenantes bacterium RBG_16_63_16]|nr:MAG: tRNA-specific adenosine deaminase [Candidatus Aminicenantes bacterium RBG_16_63_16]